MSHRSIQGNSRGSRSSDTIVKSSSESEEISQQKHEENSVNSKKNPRMESIGIPIDTKSDAKNAEPDKLPKHGRSLGEKIKSTWKEVKEKLSDKSSHTPKAKTSKGGKFQADDPSLLPSKRTELWQENSRNLFSNIKTLGLDFKQSQDIIKALIIKGGENFAASEFNAENYAGLGFDFSSTMTDGALINPMNIFGSKSVITSTKTTAQELLADTEDATIRPNYALNKPIKLCASGIGPALFSNQLLNILREIPLTCPVILDVSSNNLGPHELLELVRLMEEHPVIYYLDLGNNPICTDKNACFALIKLFDALGPVSRLFLNNTGFNDVTAEFVEYPLCINPCLRHLNLQNNSLTEVGISLMINAAIPGDFFDRKNNDTALVSIQLQNNTVNDWDQIITTIDKVFRRAGFYGKNFATTSPKTPLQLDFPATYIQELSSNDDFWLEVTKPQTDSIDDRL